MVLDTGNGPGHGQRSLTLAMGLDTGNGLQQCQRAWTLQMGLGTVNGPGHCQCVWTLSMGLEIANGSGHCQWAMRSVCVSSSLQYLKKHFVQNYFNIHNSVKCKCKFSLLQDYSRYCYILQQYEYNLRGIEFNMSQKK